MGLGCTRFLAGVATRACCERTDVGSTAEMGFGSHWHHGRWRACECDTKIVEYSGGSIVLGNIDARDDTLDEDSCVREGIGWHTI